jgi:hypothetical protein
MSIHVLVFLASSLATLPGKFSTETIKKIVASLQFYGKFLFCVSSTQLSSLHICDVNEKRDFFVLQNNSVSNDFNYYGFATLL